MPTLQEFVHRAIHEFQAILETSIFVIEGPRGPVIIRRLARPIGGGRIAKARLPDILPSDPLTSARLRSLCIQLRISPEAFGVGP